MSAVDDNICGVEVSFSTGHFLTRQVWTARCTKTWGHELKAAGTARHHTGVVLADTFYMAARWFTDTDGTPYSLTVNDQDKAVV